MFWKKQTTEKGKEGEGGKCNGKNEIGYSAPKGEQYNVGVDNESGQATGGQVKKKGLAFLDYIIISGLAVGIMGGVGVFALFFYVSSSEIDIDSLLHYKPEEATIVYDKEGGIIAEIAKERRIFTPIEDIPEILKQSFIAAEDRTFYKNPGVDIVGLARAMVQNMGILLRGNKERYIGASTIAQQVVRNLLLTNERTVIRKVKEIALAYKISAKLPKDRIFEIYLNHIFLGSRSYGVATAAKTYFQKELSELSLDQCALLAALPKAPSILDPRKNPGRAIARRNWVLGRMLAEGFISKREFEVASREEIVVHNKTEEVFGWAFIEYMKKILEQKGINKEDLGVGGYRIHTTMNRKWQGIVQEEMDKGLIAFSKRQGYKGPEAKIEIGSGWQDRLKNEAVNVGFGALKKAVVLSVNIVNKEEGRIVIGLEDGTRGNLSLQSIKWATKRRIADEDNKYNTTELTEVLKAGDIIAVQQEESDQKGMFSLEQVPDVNGGVVVMSVKSGEILAMVGSYGDMPASFNRAVQAIRQSGSTVKPFIYLSALENGIGPTDIFMDAEMSFDIGDGEVWTPKNVNNTYNGPVTLRRGLEESINTVTLRIADRIGLGKAIKTMKRFELMVNYPHNLSIVLGSGETTLLSLVRAYAAIANYGEMVTPKLIEKVTLTSGEVVSIDHLTKISRSGIIGGDDDGWVPSEEQYGKGIAELGNAKTVQVTTPQVAYQMISILKGTALRSSIARRLQNVKDVPLGGKTGTSQHGRDLWFVGITPEVAIGVFVGHDTPKDSPSEYGSTAALPIFAGIIEKIKPDLQKKDFYVPDKIKLIKIDRRNGKISTGSGGNIIYEAFKEGDELPSDREDQYQGKMADTHDEIDDLY